MKNRNYNIPCKVYPALGDYGKNWVSYIRLGDAISDTQWNHKK